MATCLILGSAGKRLGVLVAAFVKIMSISWAAQRLSLSMTLENAVHLHRPISDQYFCAPSRSHRGEAKLSTCIAKTNQSLERQRRRLSHCWRCSALGLCSHHANPFMMPMRNREIRRHDEARIIRLENPITRHACMYVRTHRTVRMTGVRNRTRDGPKTVTRRSHGARDWTRKKAREGTEPNARTEVAGQRRLCRRKTVASWRCAGDHRAATSLSISSRSPLCSGDEVRERPLDVASLISGLPQRRGSSAWQNGSQRTNRSGRCAAPSCCSRSRLTCRSMKSSMEVHSERVCPLRDDVLRVDVSVQDALAVAGIHGSQLPLADALVLRLEKAWVPVCELLGGGDWLEVRGGDSAQSRQGGALQGRESCVRTELNARAPLRSPFPSRECQSGVVCAHPTGVRGADMATPSQELLCSKLYGLGADQKGRLWLCSSDHVSRSPMPPMSELAVHSQSCIGGGRDLKRLDGELAALSTQKGWLLAKQRRTLFGEGLVTRLWVTGPVHLEQSAGTLEQRRR